MEAKTAQNYKVYKHTFPNGKSYIGITSQTLARRFNNGKGYIKCPKMHNAILKYGWQNVEHELLFGGLSKQEAEAKEIETITFFNSIENGYNTDHGGNAFGTHSIETREKISAANKGKKKSPCTEERKTLYSKMYSGSGNPFYGRHHSESAKAKHSEFMKGNQYNKGNRHSDEFKAQKSAQMKEKYSNGGNPRCKAVIRTDKDGNTTRYYSLRKAAAENGIAAATLLKHITGQYNGYSWGYEHYENEH